MHTLTGVPAVGFHLYRRRRRFAPLTPAYYKEKPSARVIPFDKLRDRTLTPAYYKEKPSARVIPFDRLRDHVVNTFLIYSMLRISSTRILFQLSFSTPHS